MQFAESSFTKEDLNTANCLSDWPVLNDFYVRILSANHIAGMKVLLYLELTILISGGMRK